MKKLLLVMLVPVLVLGIIGCAQGVTETEVDAYIQGMWGSLSTPAPVAEFPAIGGAADAMTLYVSANQVTVKNAVGVSNPFRVEFAYQGVGDHKNRVDVAALATGGSVWVAADATTAGNTLVDLLGAINFGNIVSGDSYITFGALKDLTDRYFENAVATALFPSLIGADAAATIVAADLTAAVTQFGLLIPPGASEVIIGDLQMYTWESNIDLGKFKTLMVANAAAAGTNLHILKFTPPSGDQWWYKYDNILTKPPVGTYTIKGQM